MYASTSESPSEGAPQISPTDEASPQAELPPLVLGLQRHNSDYGYPPQQLSLPPHLRADLQQSISRTSSPLNSQHFQNYTSAPQQRPITSYPTAYGPPQPMEPPTNGTASGGASPYLGAWPSPGQGTLPPPIGMENSAYHESGFAAPPLSLHHMANHQHGGHQLYYGAANGIGRPQSTEPKDYGLHHHQSQMPSVPLPTGWNSDPMDTPDNRQAGYGAWRDTIPGRTVNSYDNH